MKLTPSLDEIKEIAASGKYDIAPVMGEILSDVATPVQVMRIMMNISEHCYMLESAEDNEQWGRYSFLGCSPKSAISAVNGVLKIDDLTIEDADPRKYIRQIMEKNRSPKIPGRMTSEIKPYFTREQYCEMVQKAKHYIKEGDIFQIVLSNRLEADFEGSLFNTYRVLRTLNPSPYMLYFSGSDMEVAGSSPETLVKLQDGTLHTFPLAGTRPRGKTREEDDRLEKELLADPKELAEHNMLVDLGRNDIGKLSKFGTVEVEKYHVIEKYSHVMHIGSTVKGEIRDDLDALDAVDSVLPAGTLSGAPKLRACQLINDLENNKRGIYGGAIGYIDFTGNLDCCIAIRIAYKKNNKVFIRSGAGIVYDSVPENEYQECLNKAAAVVSALKTAEEEDL